MEGQSVCKEDSDDSYQSDSSNGDSSNEEWADTQEKDSIEVKVFSKRMSASKGTLVMTPEDINHIKTGVVNKESIPQMEVLDEDDEEAGEEEGK